MDQGRAVACGGGKIDGGNQVINIKQVETPDEKSAITLKVMHSLPAWFSPPEDIEKKAVTHRAYPFFAVYDDDKPIGFIALKIHNEYTVDIFNVGILEQYHRQGIGRRLLHAAEQYCVDKGYLYFTVKTLDASAEYEPYERTRVFYQKMGFIPLEVFTTFWNEENPCLFLVKRLDRERENNKYNSAFWFALDKLVSESEGYGMNMRIISDITDYIFISDKPENADVIFLPGGSDPALPEKAAELYNAGFSSHVIPSGGKSVNTGKFAGVKRKTDLYDSAYQTDCEFYIDVLLKSGVPASAIIGENQSGYTKENAILSRKAADDHGLTVQSAIVVCKSFHARRCLMCYQFAFPETNISVVPVDVYDITRENWYAHEYGIDRVMGELSRCGNQFVDEVKGWLEVNVL
jgi:uncharacterized SAM-binding protein YcdF (DUF218 family)/GNAT superfamily N-acetyltransferase